MSSGAMDFLGWPCPPSDLTDMVTRLNQVAVRIGPRERNRAKARRLVNLLSRREKDVLNGLVSGASNKEMARQLGISPRTVEIHRAAMMSRLNAQSAADAVRIGLYAGLDTSD